MRYFAEQGMTPISYLDSLGLCGPRLLAVHCIHMNQEDIALMAASGVRIAACIGSNTKAGKGVAPIRDAARAGIPDGLGTDGPSSGNTLSLFDQMRLLALSQKTAYHDRSLFPAREIVRAATRGGAEALGMTLADTATIELADDGSIYYSMVIMDMPMGYYFTKAE